MQYQRVASAILHVAASPFDFYVFKIQIYTVFTLCTQNETSETTHSITQLSGCAQLFDYGLENNNNRTANIQIHIGHEWASSFNHFTNRQLHYAYTRSSSLEPKLIQPIRFSMRYRLLETFNFNLFWFRSLDTIKCWANTVYAPSRLHYYCYC